MTQIMFETFNSPYFYTCNDGVLTLISTGHTTGVILDVGYDSSQIVPISDCTIISHSFKYQKIGGNYLTKNFLKILANKNSNIYLPAHNYELQEIKKRNCFVSLDFNSDMRKKYDISVNLKDSNDVQVGNERFSCFENFFLPNNDGFDNGVSKEIYNSIEECSTNIQNEFYKNIVINGGTTLLKNFGERVKMDVKKLVPPSTQVIASGKENGTWIGGSIYASTSVFPKVVVTREEYNNEGPGVIHRKKFIKPI